jgi:hypothetical protein
MAARYYETAEFAALNREWRKRLRAEGFVDIESNDKLLRYDHSDYGDARRLSAPSNLERAAYYELVTRWLHQRVWPSRHVKRLWELHTEGVGVRMSTVRCRPAVGNAKSNNERLMARERAEMRKWLGTEVLAGAEQDATGPDSLWAEAMLAEGWDVEGYRDDEAMRAFDR